MRDHQEALNSRLGDQGGTKTEQDFRSLITQLIQGAGKGISQGIGTAIGVGRDVFKGLTQGETFKLGGKTGPGFTEPMQQPKGSDTLAPRQGPIEQPPQVLIEEPSQDGRSEQSKISSGEAGGGIVIRSGGKDQPQVNLTVPSDISNVLTEVFGDEANDAASVLHHPFGIQKKGEGQGENAGFQVDNIDISNEDFDTPHNNKQFVGDVKGKDGKWHSIDRGLFRINSRTFQTFLFGREERKAMFAAGIIDDAHEDGNITKAEVQRHWDRMNNMEDNIKMAKIIKEVQGWDAWFAAPDYLVENLIES